MLLKAASYKSIYKIPQLIQPDFKIASSQPEAPKLCYVLKLSLLFFCAAPNTKVPCDLKLEIFLLSMSPQQAEPKCISATSGEDTPAQIFQEQSSETTFPVGIWFISNHTVLTSCSSHSRAFPPIHFLLF